MLAETSGREVERRGGGPAVLLKPTGAGKRKGQNPVKQILDLPVPLDLSVRAAPPPSQLAVTPALKKVILTVPQYKKVTASPLQEDKVSELTITPVIKKEEPVAALDNNSNCMNSNSLMQSLLTGNSPILHHFKQASSLLHQQGEAEIQQSLWNSLVTSSMVAQDQAGEEKKKIHKCDFAGCDKVYTKSSHLKAHKR